MTRAEAAEILEQLLEGIDPVTGEVLPDDHVCAARQVMRALHMGYVALMQPPGRGADRLPENSPASRENTHNNWSDEEDQYLRQAWRDNVPVDEMRRYLRRTLRSVKCRLVYLNIAGYEILGRKYQPAKGCEHSGLPWYPEEDEALRAFHAARVNLHDVARQFRRSYRAVVLHMASLNLLTAEERDALLAGQEGGTPS